MGKQRRQKLTTASTNLNSESKRSGYINIPTSLIRSPLISPGAKLLYAELLTYAWNSSCYVGHRNMAAELKMSRGTVGKYLKELRRLGLVNWEGKSELNTNIYFLLPLPAVLLDDSELAIKNKKERLKQMKTTVSSKFEHSNLSKNCTDPSSIAEHKVIHKEIPPTSGGGSFSVGGDQEKGKPDFLPDGLSPSEAGGVASLGIKVAQIPGYAKLTDIEVYQLCKKHTVEPADIYTVQSDIFDLIERDELRKKTTMFQSVDEFTKHRIQVGTIEPISDPLYFDLIENAHPLNIAGYEWLGLEDRRKYLKEKYKQTRNQLSQSSSDNASKAKLEEIVAEAQQLKPKWQAAWKKLKEAKNLYPDRFASLMAKRGG